MAHTYCLFCRIVSGREGNVIFYEDDDVIVFNDIKPAAEYHLLAIPTKHIRDVSELKPTDRELLEKLKSAGERVLNEHILEKYKCVSALLPSPSGPQTVSVPQLPIQTIFGFHIPPHNSQHHLHMHIVAPADDLTKENRERVLGVGCFRFISYKDQLEKLVKSGKTAVKRGGGDGCKISPKRERFDSPQ